MELSVLERILLSQILPAEGSFANLKLLRVARENLSFTEGENLLLGFKDQGNGSVTWNQDEVTDTETGQLADDSVGKEELQKRVNENPGRYTLSPVVAPRDIKIGDVVLKLVVKAMTKLDKEEKLTESHFSLYERLMKPVEVPE